ncbi:hypothetical protein ACFLYX_02340 [Chloroflexota bacterium]
MKKLIGLAVFVVIVIVVGVAFFNLPQRIGLVETPAEKLLSQTPDRETADELMSELRASGTDTTGMDLYILPIQGTKDNPSNGNVAVAILDASQGFDLRNLSEAELMGYLETLSSVGQSGDYNIERVVVAYQDESGESLITLTAPTETILKFKNGVISREQFLKEMEGEVNFVEVAKKIAEMAQ